MTVGPSYPSAMTWTSHDLCLETTDKFNSNVSGTSNGKIDACKAAAQVCTIDASHIVRDPTYQLTQTKCMLQPHTAE